MKTLSIIIIIYFFKKILKNWYKWKYFSFINCFSL